MLKCKFKTLTGLDCPGCGFQRSVVSMLDGNFVDAFIYWPMLFPLLAAAIFTSIYLVGKKAIFMSIAYKLYILSVVFLLVNWLLKMTGVIPCPIWLFLITHENKLNHICPHLKWFFTKLFWIFVHFPVFPTISKVTFKVIKHHKSSLIE